MLVRDVGVEGREVEPVELVELFRLLGLASDTQKVQTFIRASCSRTVAKIPHRL